MEPLIICLVQPAPGGTPAYKGRADAEPDTRPAPRGGRGGARDGSHRGERPERAPRERGESSYSFDARKIYFGNLSWGMDHLDLQDLCGEFGTVEDSRLITDRETGRSRGFGFVTMSTTEEAEQVVRQLNGQDVDGRVLRVNIANVDK